jgi:tRNA-dihydrouridine synthase C
MQAITHLAFMRVMRHFGGPDSFVTEYFRVHSDYTLEKHILRSITENDTGRPVYAQLIGQDIPALIRTAKELLQYPVAGIDLNIGCPAPVVCRKDAGGGLLRKKELLNTIVAALRNAIPEGKFTIKTRLGYESTDEFEDLLEIFHRHRIDLLTIHGRTVKERYQTPIHTSFIRRAVQQMNCPVIANGNVVDATTAQGLISQTGADGLMIGRGAIRNPWIFSQIRSIYHNQSPHTVTRADLLEYITRLDDEISTSQDSFDELKHVQHMKKYLVYIVQGLDETFEHRIRRVRTPAEFHEACQDFLNSPEPVPPLPPSNTKLFCGFESLL